jgi:transposase-like protein
MTIKSEMLDELTAQCKTPEDVEALSSQLLQRMINRSLDAEMDAHLGYDRHDKGESARTIRCNGKTKKTPEKICHLSGGWHPAQSGAGVGQCQG